MDELKRFGIAGSFAWIALLVATTVQAQSAAQSALTDAGHAASAPMIQAAPLQGVLDIDGRLDEGQWRNAPAVTEFTQLEPVEGAPATEPTEVHILFDDAAIYIGAILHDSQPISTRLGRRDEDFDDADLFAVSFDSYHDHRTAFRFSVNPSGLKTDETMSGGGNFGGGDTTWDAVWDGRATVTDDGWMVEMRIPFSQLRFGPQERQTWGIQLERRIARNQEADYLAFTPRNEPGGVPRYGHLAGMEGLRSQGRLELLPYLSARADGRLVERSDLVDFADPYHNSGLDLTGGIGLDLRYRVASNFTLNATVNPDFGQAEVDPAVVNLSAFETRYQERRPFFIEGANIFNFGGGGGGGTNLIYSRRIGRPPQMGVSSSAVYSKVPEQTTILGAAKLSGRTASGWSIGVLEAVTSEETAKFVDAQGVSDASSVEPITNYLASRVRREMRGGRTTLGGLLTAVNRRLEGEARDRLRESAYSAGVDLSHEWADRSWSLTANFSPSYIRGSEAVITTAQRSSARYYHRPDATHLDVDPAATSLGGYSTSIRLSEEAGSVTGSLQGSTVSPGYEVNDLGFQSTADRINFRGDLEYRQTRPGDIFRDWQVSTDDQLGYNYGGI